MMLNDQKRKIRSDVRAALAKLCEPELQCKSDVICRRLADTPGFLQAACIMLYLPIDGEVRLGGLARQAWRAGKTVCAPTSPLDREMRAIEIRPENMSLFSPEMGLRSPLGREIFIDEIDFIVVPGLAFDRNGGRLGRGGGFYDRFLKKTDLRAEKIGAAFIEQIQPVLPMDINDALVDKVVTD